MGALMTQENAERPRAKFESDIHRLAFSGCSKSVATFKQDITSGPDIRVYFGPWLFAVRPASHMCAVRSGRESSLAHASSYGGRRDRDTGTGGPASRTAASASARAPAHQNKRRFEARASLRFGRLARTKRSEGPFSAPTCKPRKTSDGPGYEREGSACPISNQSMLPAAILQVGIEQIRPPEKG